MQRPYAAYLGHQPHLSIAELAATLPDFKLEKIVGSSVLLFSTSAEITQKHVSNLGGTVLVAEEIRRGKSVDLSQVPDVLHKEVSKVKGKVTFSIRAAGLDPRMIHGLYRDCKHYLKRHGKPARYVGNERKPAAAVLLRDAGLLDGNHGCEIMLLGEERFFWVGRTIAAHDPDAYTKRDIGKPIRDTRTGLLPPKLAQIMLNLGLWLWQKNREGKKEQKEGMPKFDPKNPQITVFDPFCGTGVILLEALNRKWLAIGSDLSEKAVKGAQKNIEWLRKEEELLKTSVPSAVYKHNAVKPFSFTAIREERLKRGPDVVVTETTLGPPLSERPSQKETLKIRSKMEEIESAFIENAAKTLPGVPVVLTFPMWYLRTGPLMLEKVWKAIADNGYKAVLPPGATPSMRGKQSLLYRRADQIVGREVVLLLPA